ncbi:MAG: hypothetical protein AB7V16_10305 [Vulcanibacillus sp.]
MSNKVDSVYHILAANKESISVIDVIVETVRNTRVLPWKMNSINA